MKIHRVVVNGILIALFLNVAGVETNTSTYWAWIIGGNLFMAVLGWVDDENN